YEAGQSGGNFASRSDKYIDGYGRMHGEISYTIGYTIDAIETKYDQVGRISQQTRPYHEGEAQQWYTMTYDSLDRATQITAPDDSVAQRFYNESNYPSAATQGAPGSTMRIRDPWGRERWGRFDAQGRPVEVVEPDPLGNGSVASNGLLTQ